MKELSKENRLDENVIYTIMTEEKANQKEKISFKMEDIYGESVKEVQRLLISILF